MVSPICGSAISLYRCTNWYDASGDAVVESVVAKAKAQSVPWLVQVGSVLTIDSGANQDTVVVSPICG